MTRSQTCTFAAIAATAILAGGTWGLVYAQAIPGREAGGAPAAKAGASTGKSIYTPLVAPRGGMGMPDMRGMSGGMPGMPGMGGPPVEQDPEMAELADAEIGLAHNADEVLSQYVAADKADDQKRLKAELRDMLTKQFDVQRQRRELELSRIEERVKKLRDQLKKRNDARDTIIDRRLEQLTNEADGLGWGQPSGSAANQQQSTPYYFAPAPNNNRR